MLKENVIVESKWVLSPLYLLVKILYLRIPTESHFLSFVNDLWFLAERVLWHHPGSPGLTKNLHWCSLCLNRRWYPSTNAISSSAWFWIRPWSSFVLDNLLNILLRTDNNKTRVSWFPQCWAESPQCIVFSPYHTQIATLRSKPFRTFQIDD